MAPDVDIAVVGGGIVGAATARALGTHAGPVVLLEQFAFGHARGSSHGASRILRLNYPDERYVRMAQAADRAWRELEEERGTTLVERLGALDLGPVAAETGRALAACGVQYSTLSAREVEERWPLRLEPGETAVYQADGGFTHAERSHGALVDSARDAGVELRASTRVLALSLGRRSVELQLERETLVARAVVVTAGAWASALLTQVDVELPVVPTRETVVYLDVPGAETIPPVIDYARLPTKGAAGITRIGQAAYALPAPGVGLKAGLHHSGPVADPNEDGVVEDGVRDWVSGWAASRYSGVGEVRGVETCLYTSTADESFVLERHGRVVVGSACSGHGFKFAPVVGRTLAELAREAAQ